MLLREDFQYKASNGIDVSYRLQYASSDRAHMVIIFSGNGTRFGFSNLAKAFKCNVLWIEDIFEGSEAYYLGHNSLLFSEAIIELINNQMDIFGLKVDDCTTLGDSKGGFAALYYGIKCNITNVVASAFISQPYKRLESFRPNIASLLGVNNKVYFNGLLRSLMEEDINSDRNIFLFFSKTDTCYIDHQK